MFFKKNKKNNDEDSLIKVAALLIHAAKIDENYSKKEKEIIKKTLLEIGTEDNNIEEEALHTEEELQEEIRSLKEDKIRVLAEMENLRKRFKHIDPFSESP